MYDSFSNISFSIFNDMSYYIEHFKYAYNKLNIKLISHDAGGLTMKDFELALRIEEIINTEKPKRPRI